MAELTSQGNVKITDGAGPGEKRFDVPPTAELALASLDAEALKLDGVAVVERGSNANGEYVRFADGTQIAWRKWTQAVDIATSFNVPSGWRRTTTQVLTWPAEFTADSPAVYLNYARQTGAAGTWYPALYAHSLAIATTGCSYVLVSPYGDITGDNFDLSYIAIGRWA